MLDRARQARIIILGVFCGFRVVEYFKAMDKASVVGVVEEDRPFIYAAVERMKEFHDLSVRPSTS